MNFIIERSHGAAVQAGVRTKQEIVQLTSEDLRVTPQDLGNVANRINIKAQFAKTTQQRFFDLFV